MAQKTSERTGIYLYNFFTNLFSECARASSYLNLYLDTPNNVWHPEEHSQKAHTFSTHVKLGCCPQNYQTQQPPRMISTCAHCIQNDSNAVMPFLIIYMFQTHGCPRYPIMCGRYLIELSLSFPESQLYLVELISQHVNQATTWHWTQNEFIHNLSQWVSVTPFTYAPLQYLFLTEICSRWYSSHHC
jgi:hypothetical protein